MPAERFPPHKYSVEISSAIANTLRQLHEQAVREQRGRQFATALAECTKRLEEDPRSFGEPMYRLPMLQLLVRHGAVRPLFVDFAVHDERPLVFIRKVQLLPAD